MTVDYVHSRINTYYRNGPSPSERLGRKMSKDRVLGRRICFVAEGCRRIKSLVEGYVSRSFEPKVDPSNRRICFDLD